MVRELADYERAADAVEADEESIRAALFGPDPAVFAHVAEHGGEVVGFALWFRTFSTWHGRHGIYLEDLYVRPPARGRGHGRALLAELARIAVDAGHRRLEWSVLDWNVDAQEVYRSVGAVPMSEWTVWRLSGEPLAELGRPASGPRSSTLIRDHHVGTTTAGQGGGRVTDLPQDVSMRDVVTIKLPATSAYLSVLRTATAALAARLDFTLDDIEDLRIAVDEACALLLATALPGADIESEFALRGDVMQVSVRAPTVDGLQPPRDTFAWTVLTALVGEVDSGVDADNRVSIVLRKKRSAAESS